MKEKPVVLKIENIKKRYKIKVIKKKPENKIDSAKLALKSFLNPNSNKEDFWALSGVNFNVEQGEKIGIIGKNGAGKSTLLKIISRITEPTDGRIEMLGKISSMLEVGTGFNSELTGRENVYLNGAILGMTKAEIDAKFDEILEFSEVGKFIDTPVKRYSSGMFVRLAFAVASHLEPDILLVDEVLAVGDTRFQKKCIDKMLEIAASGKTILFVSHQMNTIRQLCDRVIVLSKGKVIFDGDVEEGIKIYNSDIYTEKKLHYEYKNLHRSQAKELDKAEVLSLDILNTDTCVYKVNESIDFNIKVNIKIHDLGDISLRAFFWQNDDSPVSVCFSKPFANINTPGEYNFNVKITDHHLNPGVYKATLNLLGGSSRVNENNLDYISPAFVFEVVNEDGTATLWARDWGRCNFKNLEINPI
ncbi:MAG: ABC transporter ATP-binding protein [Clostridia bacterium]|nr:ABC transporter ATP-binding protein [Clostridia bacterium]